MIISRLGIRWGERAEERRKIADREAITEPIRKIRMRREKAVLAEIGLESIRPIGCDNFLTQRGTGD